LQIELVFKALKQDPEDQDVHRHLAQCGTDGGVVRAHQHAAAALPATALTIS
jgi:hypothetical protein